MPAPTFQTAETTLPPIDAAIDAPFDPSIGAATDEDRAAERVLRLWKHHAERGVIPKEGTTKKAKAYARVNAGRWIVDCPFPPCGSAQVPAWSDHRFFCIECENRAVGGKWVPVVWPSPVMVGKIEAALRVRPAANQHWVPGETVKELLQENTEHGHDAALIEQLEAAKRDAAVVLPWEVEA